jgi:signal transduction histidine kinase
MTTRGRPRPTGANTFARKIVAVIRIVLLIGLLTGTLVYLILNGLRFDLHDAIISFVCGVSYTAVMALAQCGAIALVARWLPLQSRREIPLGVLVHGAAIVISFILATLCLRLLYNLPFLWNRGALIVIGLVALSGSILLNGISYLERFHKRMRAAESAALESELAALRAQINPHFLFNSLNSIAALIRINPERAESLVESLADLFRYTLRTSEQPAVTLAEDVAATELYLEIERARFGERLEVTIDIPVQLAKARVPSMMLQPLVENAIKHGVSPGDGRSNVDVRAAMDGDDVVISIDDTGPGFSTTDLDALAVRGTGLRNVRDRLRHMFGDAGRVTIARNGVELRFPFRSSAHGMEERR